MLWPEAEIIALQATSLVGGPIAQRALALERGGLFSFTKSCALRCTGPSPGAAVASIGVARSDLRNATGRLARAAPAPRRCARRRHRLAGSRAAVVRLVVAEPAIGISYTMSSDLR